MVESIFESIRSIAALSSEGGAVNSFLDLAIALVIVIIAAKLGGLISLRLGQPSVLGELLVGLILGPSLLDFLHWGIFEYSSSFTYDDLVLELHQWAEIGVLLLMFMAGLQLHLSDLARSGKVAGYAGVLGVVFPMVLGFGAGEIYGFPASESIFIGLVLSATSVSISAQTLMELGQLRTRVGFGLLGAAVFDDVLVVLGISVFFALVAGPGAGSIGEILLIFLRMILFIVGAGIVGLWILPRVTELVDKLPISKGLMAFVFATMLIYGWLAEILGNVAPITGAFLAGLLFARSRLSDRIEEQISTLAYGVFVPIFFVSVGLAADVRAMGIVVLGLMGVMTIIAIVGKVTGAGLGARLAGMTNRESLQLGVGMMSRGEVGLIVANQGITQGLIGGDIFSAVVGVVLITTLLTPLMLRSLFRKETDESEAMNLASDGGGE